MQSYVTSAVADHPASAVRDFNRHLPGGFGGVHLVQGLRSSGILGLVFPCPWITCLVSAGAADPAALLLKPCTPCTFLAGPSACPCPSQQATECSSWPLLGAILNTWNSPQQDILSTLPCLYMISGVGGLSRQKLSTEVGRLPDGTATAWSLERRGFPESV